MFVDIPIRQNGQKIVASWYNILRSAGLAIETWMGTGFIQQTSFTIANNQGVAANVTGLLLDSSISRSAKLEIDIYRYTTGGGGVDLKEVKTMLAFYKIGAGGWDLMSLDPSGPDDAGVVFTITAPGQVQYTSTNIAGTPNTSRIIYKATTFGL